MVIKIEKLPFYTPPPAAVTCMLEHSINGGPFQLDSTNIVVQPDGTLPAPFAISGINGGDKVQLRAKSLCGHAWVIKDINVPAPTTTTTTPAPTTTTTTPAPTTTTTTPAPTTTTTTPPPALNRHLSAANYYIDGGSIVGTCTVQGLVVHRSQGATDDATAAQQGVTVYFTIATDNGQSTQFDVVFAPGDTQSSVVDVNHDSGGSCASITQETIDSVIPA